MRQDKLSEEVQKQHDGPEDNGSPPATQAKPDTGLPPSADADANASQAEEEEDSEKTKPLLERLKALEVTITLFSFHFFTSLTLCLLFFSLLCSSSSPPPFIHTSSHPWLSFVASLSASCQSPCSVVSESMTAHQTLQSSSFGEQSHPMRVAAGASGCSPASVCFLLRLGI